MTEKEESTPSAPDEVTLRIDEIKKHVGELLIYMAAEERDYNDQFEANPEQAKNHIWVSIEAIAGCIGLTADEAWELYAVENRQQKTVGRKGSKVGDPGMILPGRIYGATPGIVFISMEKIIDRYYEEARQDYKTCRGNIPGVDNLFHVFPHMDRVMVFLEELRHCDEQLDPHVEEDEAGAGSSAEKQNVR